MMKSRSVGHKIENVLALVLFAVFALCVAAVLIGGAGAYRRIGERGEKIYADRTAAQYLAARVRQCEGAVRLAQRGEGDALELHEEIENRAYVTYIYCSDGWLCEYFADGELEFSPEFGERVLPAQGLTARTTEDGLLALELQLEDGKVPVCLSLADSGRWPE